MKFPEKAELLERFNQYTDQEIIQILSHAKEYQQAAVDAVEEIARKRGLDWKQVAEPEKKDAFSIFPSISTPSVAIKVAQSIQRILYLVALIPLVTAALAWTDGYPSLSIAYALLAVLWAMSAFFSFQRRKHQIVLFFFPLTLFMAIMRYLTAGLPLHFTLIDWAVIAICLLVLLYLVLFYKSILKSVQ